MWKIKDPKLKQWVNRFFSDEKIDKACRAQLEDGAFCVSLHDLGKGVFLDLSNRVFSWNTGGFNPDEWNPYPAIKPTVSGFYLLTVKLKDQPNVKPFVTIGCLDPFGYWEKYTDSEVLAFRELPEAYEKEKEK